MPHEIDSVTEVYDQVGLGRKAYERASAMLKRFSLVAEAL